MKKHGLAIITGIAAMGVAGYLAYPEIKQILDPQGAFLDACENALKDRLKAPSTYQRTKEPLVTVEEVTVEEAMPVTPREAENEEYRKSRDAMRYVYRQEGAFRHTAFIWYESANSFGAPVAELSTCDYYSYKMTPPASDDLRFADVKIDGQTNFDRIMESAAPFLH